MHSAYYGRVDKDYLYYKLSFLSVFVSLFILKDVASIKKIGYKRDYLYRAVMLNKTFK